MRFRGITLHGKPYEFSIKDCPTQLNDKMTALSNKPGAPLLYTRSLSRVSDDLVVREYDMVYETSTKRFIGFVIYRNGFCVLVKKTGEVIPISELEDFSLCGNESVSIMTELSRSSQTIRWKSGHDTFSIYDMLKIIDNCVFCCTLLTKPIDINSALLCTGLTKGGVHICFGDIMSDGIVELHHYKPMVRTSAGEYREFMEGEYDEQS